MAASLTGTNRKYRRLAVTILIMMVLAALQPLVWGLVHGQALALQQKQSQGQQIANVRDRNADIVRELQTAREFLSQIEAISPPVTAKTQVVERVEQLADQLGLHMDITVIRELPTDDAAVSDDRVVPVSMSVAMTGTLPQLLSFLDRVEHTQELSLVPRWTLVPAPVPAPTLAPSPTPAAAPPYTLTMDIYFFLRRASDGE